MPDEGPQDGGWGTAAPLWRDPRTLALTAGLVVVHLWLSAKVPWPTIVFDENGYLGNARLLAGGAVWEMPFAPSYASGYPLLLAPLTALIGDPDHLWRAIQVLSAVLLATLLPFLATILERVLGLGRRRALVAATVGALAPAVLAASSSAVAENLVLPAVTAMVLALWTMLDEGARWPTRVWFGPACAVLIAAHPRFTVVLPLAVGLLVAWGRRPGRHRVAAANGAALLVLAVAGWALNRSVRSARWDAVERLEGDLSSWWRLATSWSGLQELATTAIGQVWYLAAGSLGLVVVGLVGALAELRPRPARAPIAATLRARRRTVLAFLLALAGAVFATSVLFFAQNQFRADHFTYGRHNDSFTPLWTAIGVGVLLGAPAHRRRVATLVAAIAIGTTGTLLVILRDPTDLGSTFSPFAVPAIVRFVELGPSGTFQRATLLAGASAIVIAVAQRAERLRRPVAGALAVALASWSLWSGLGVVEGTATFGRLVYADWDPISTVERLGVDELCIDASAARARANLTYAWYLPEVDVRSYDAAAGEEPSCAFSIARFDDDARRAAGDRVATLDQSIVYLDWEAPAGLALWVAPGSDQARLEALGALLPDDFPASLPASARQVEVRRTGPAVVRTRPGGRSRMEVQVEHLGTGSPWPDRASWSSPGHVRIVAEITPLDARDPQGARSGGELPRWMLPGDRSTTTIEIVAVDRFLGPLPPGRYDVQLGIAQQGQDAFASGGPEGHFTLEVEG